MCHSFSIPPYLYVVFLKGGCSGSEMSKYKYKSRPHVTMAFYVDVWVLYKLLSHLFSLICYHCSCLLLLLQNPAIGISDHLPLGKMQKGPN